MNLNSIHSILHNKKYYYFSGNSNSDSSDLFYNFSTHHTGRGNYLDLRLGLYDNDITLYLGDDPIVNKNINDAELLLIIENYI